MQLVRYEAARQALQAAVRVNEVKDIRDKAQALAAYARQAKDTALVEWATEIKVRAERRAGEMLRESAAKGERATRQIHAGSMSNDATCPPDLEDLGISRDQSSRWQKLAAIPDEKFEQAVSAAKEVAREVTTAGLLRMNAGHVRHNSGENEWYTPRQYTEAAARCLGAIDVDPASSDEANKLVGAKKYYTVESNGLDKPWHGRVWMNPPYAQPLIAQFCEKLVAEISCGNTNAACVLVNNATETAWFQSLLTACSAVCFPSGRVKFFDKEGKATGAPLQGQAVLYFGKDVSKFCEEFECFGTILRAA